MVSRKNAFNLMLAVTLLEMARGLDVVGGGIFEHIGNADNIFFLFLALTIVHRLFPLSKEVYNCIYLIVIPVAIYFSFAAEIAGLWPDYGTPDLLDIPAGLVGLVFGMYYAYPRKETDEAPAPATQS